MKKLKQPEAVSDQQGAEVIFITSFFFFFFRNSG